MLVHPAEQVSDRVGGDRTPILRRGLIRVIRAYGFVAGRCPVVERLGGFGSLGFDDVDIHLVGLGSRDVGVLVSGIETVGIGLRTGLGIVACI